MVRYWTLFAGDHGLKALTTSAIFQGTALNGTKLKNGQLSLDDFPEGSLQQFGGLRAVKERVAYVPTQGSPFMTQKDWLWKSKVSKTVYSSQNMFLMLCFTVFSCLYTASFFLGHSQTHSAPYLMSSFL